MKSKKNQHKLSKNIFYSEEMNHAMMMVGIEFRAAAKANRAELALVMQR